MQLFFRGAGLVAHLLHLWLAACSFLPDTPPEEGYGAAFLYLFGSILALLLCLLLYLLDGFLSFLERQSRAELLRLLAVLLSAPLALMLIGYGVVPTVLWGVWTLGLFVLQILSFFLPPWKEREASQPPVLLAEVSMPIRPHGTRREPRTKLFALLALPCQLLALWYALLAERAELPGPLGRQARMTLTLLAFAALLYLSEAVLSFVRVRGRLPLLRLLAGTLTGLLTVLAFALPGAFTRNLSALSSLLSLVLAVILILSPPEERHGTPLRSEDTAEP